MFHKLLSGMYLQLSTIVHKMITCYLPFTYKSAEKVEQKIIKFEQITPFMPALITFSAVSIEMYI